MPVAQQMTAEEFLALPVPQHGRPWNLVGGEVVVNDPSFLHVHIQATLYRALHDWARRRAGRGTVTWPMDVLLDDRSVFVPDLLWYAEGNVPALRSSPPYPLPDVAVEVRSSSTWRYDIGAKKATYERHGLRELWLVDTAADAVLVFRRKARGSPTFDVALELDTSDQLTSPQLAGLTVAVGDLFPPR